MRSTCSKRGTAVAAAATGGGDSLLERLPSGIINEILSKLELETLSSAAAVSKTLRSFASQILADSSSLDLSMFSPDSQTLNQILPRLSNLEKITLDCFRLDDSSISRCLGPNVQELVLLKCTPLSYHVVADIGICCPNLRLLTLEFTGGFDHRVVSENLMRICRRCRHLESLRIKMRGSESDSLGALEAIDLSETLRVLKLQPMVVDDAIRLIDGIGITRDSRSIWEASTKLGFDIPYFPTSLMFTLKSLSLVLDVITDRLIGVIASTLPLLVELQLEDKPIKEPLRSDDLTNNGLQSLSKCLHITTLSLVRSRQHYVTSFKQVNDVGMLVLFEACKGLESVRLSGFSKVSDAGFTSIINSCHNLKSLEIHNAANLSDLSFDDIGKARNSLVEIKLSSCTSITSEAVEELASARNLRILDLFGCKSVGDSCLSKISLLNGLTHLNLAGADVTDNGMAILGRLNSPVAFLCLRGCKRVTDKGVAFLLHGGEISKTLSSLDLGHMPGISDEAVHVIVSHARAIKELCIRYCFHVTDVGMKSLALDSRLHDGEKKLLRRLDLYRCTGLSVGSIGLLRKPFLHGLWWLGVGSTQLTSKGDVGLAEIREGRPWLTLCPDGCEMGCHDGWQFHKVR